MNDYLDILFPGHQHVTQAETDAGLAAMRAEDQARLAAQRATEQARAAERAANRCPRCMGEGRIAQFQHRKGGECFTCGGSGIFTRHSA